MSKRRCMLSFNIISCFTFNIVLYSTVCMEDLKWFKWSQKRMKECNLHQIFWKCELWEWTLFMQQFDTKFLQALVELALYKGCKSSLWLRHVQQASSFWQPLQRLFMKVRGGGTLSCLWSADGDNTAPFNFCGTRIFTCFKVRYHSWGPSTSQRL